ncbi:MAG: Tol-Pal system beta propeller repeat protein TolB [Candidatus Parabeggiatoa sp. nov. 2]|nr:MAG: Tol-Pal system beta propeller repeat protein TolB [Beggiatoa sp. 4572_84]RKZ48907.1 MAG: Tol-Pal system beta propeller repeat protein TolB [Gammaproteobacteria bacterium]
MRTLWLCLLSYIVLFSHVHAILTIDIIGGKEEGGQPIAIVPFGLETGMPSPYQNIAKIVSNDLHRSGRFATMPVHLLPEQPSYSDQIRFRRWQAAGMPHLVIGRIAGGLTGGYTVEFELFDVSRRKPIIGYRYTADAKTLRQVAHQISDDIYKALTGKRGVFSTRIVYVTVLRRGLRTQYHLYIADADGANPRLMLRSKEPVLSPCWSPDGQRIAYVTYSKTKRTKNMAVYIQEIRTGRRTRVSARRGLNAAPAWSPDGKHLALTLSKDGNPEIYLLNLRTGALTRLTHHQAIDTEPEWSPNGNSLVFTSDRSGKPQIYRMSANGGKAQRLTFKGDYNARPRFSPDGRKLALLHGSGNKYQIAVLTLSSGKLDILSKTTLDESPSFAPNGSMIIYATGTELAAVSIDGRVRQRLAVDMSEEVREPAWSPFYR